MRVPLAALAAAFALAAAAAGAAPPVVAVEAVQYPAWLERSGASVPLEPGAALAAGDRLRTGPDARARLRLSDGSSVKLGEDARFEIVYADDGSVLRAGLRVLSGAFRYATEGPAKPGRRAIDIAVKNVSAGIRGTDLWGKSTDERDWVVLIEGRITVSSPGEPGVVLERPLDYYELPRGGTPRVRQVDPKQLGLWALETEMREDAAVGRADGRWRVVAARPGARGEAEALARRLREAGYPARLEGEGASLAVVVPGLAGEAQARALAARLKREQGLDSPEAREG
ncbi:MAG: FecR domain-containing protein [Burkholderiales bacterium]